MKILIWISVPSGTSEESACSAGDAGEAGSIPGSGRSPGVGNDDPSSILAWKIPRTEKPGGLQSMWLQRVGHDWVTAHICNWIWNNLSQ